MKNKLFWIVIAAFFLRIGLAFSTYHSDVVPFAFAGQVIKSGRILDFYEYLWKLPDNDPILQIYPRNLFNYPPLVYFSLGGFSILTTSLLSETVHQFIFQTPQVLGTYKVNLLLFLLKLPYFIVDGVCGYFVWKYFKNPKKRFRALILWLFNPVNIFATYMMGQFDLIPVMFVLWVLHSIKHKKVTGNYIKEAILLGLGASFKIYPLLFLLPLATTQKKLWQRVSVIFAGFITYLLTILPFIFSPGFRRTALLAGQTMKSLYAILPISGGEGIILYLMFVGLVYLFFWIEGLKLKHFWRASFVMLLLFFTFTHYHPQWFLWLTPFLLFDLVKSNFKHYPFVIVSLASMFSLVFFFDTGLSIGLFSAINPKLYNLPLLFEEAVNYNFARSVLHSFFVSAAVYYLLIQLKKIGRV